MPLFCAGGIATPADASLVMQLGAEAVFVGSGIFKSGNPARMARAIVEATAHYTDADLVAKVSTGLGEAMPGQEIGRRSACTWPSVAGDPAAGSADLGGPPMTVGVLALQGDVREHAAALGRWASRCGWCADRPTWPGLTGLILPGGESTTLSLLLDSSGLREPLAAALGDGTARSSAPAPG